MNEMLNNIFDDDSLEAIRNANTISPSPEYFQKKHEEEVNYEKPSIDSIQEESIEETEKMNLEYKEEINNLKKVNKDLQLKLEAQKELLSKVVSSQNEMIKELNSLKEHLNKPSLQTVQESKSEEKIEQKIEEKQQTSQGEGLNPDDFKVENIFYYGNK